MLLGCAIGRTYTTDAYTTDLLCELILQYGWRTFSVLHSNDDEYASTYAEGLRTYSARHGLTVAASVSYEKDLVSTYAGAVGSIRDSDANIIVCISGSLSGIGGGQPDSHRGPCAGSKGDGDALRLGMSVLPLRLDSSQKAMVTRFV